MGTITGRGLKKLGNKLVFFDISEKKAKALSRLGLHVVVDISEAVENSEISLITVPTPTNGGKIDLSYIKAAIQGLGNSLRRKDSYHLVVVKSTVVPTTTEKVVIPLLERSSGKKVGKAIGVCVNPEFLTEIQKSWTDDKEFTRDFFSEERIIIGEVDKKSGDIIQKLYKPLKVPIFRTSLRTAEMIKYASNCALASRISYWNEIFYICKKIGVDSNSVAQLVGLDQRIGKYGTIHGKAFGGKCLPKDLDAFIAFSNEIGYKPKLLQAVAKINKKIRKDIGVRD